MFTQLIRRFALALRAPAPRVRVARPEAVAKPKPPEKPRPQLMRFLG